MGRFGPYVEQGERRASLPEQLAHDELNLQAAIEMLDKAADDAKKGDAKPGLTRSDAIDISPNGLNAQIIAKWQAKVAESLVTDLDPNQFLFEEAGKSDYLASIAKPPPTSLPRPPPGASWAVSRASSTVHGRSSTRT